MTWTWPLHPAPAPMPIVGMLQALRDRRRELLGHELQDHREGAGLLDGEGVGEERPGLVAALALDADLADGVDRLRRQPMWPITGMPARTSVSMIRALRTPPSTLTAWAPASRRKMPAFSSASSGVA